MTGKQTTSTTTDPARASDGERAVDGTDSRDSQVFYETPFSGASVLPDVIVSTLWKTFND
ncbi:hypothetical protein GCM10009039_25430 [Halocalculus aciditolerans]|uniref:Uncharacterized protein n=1 Tax=Halocalculus aciditolerans TaxID=1383812 RepID=A0A830FP24_9EURY|nr:hypothetical protein GCM10009039_25430 [Halocalculus aciditolerans]